MGVPICGACRRPIEERVVTALGKNWHVEHFVCAKCEKPFLGHRHYENRGLAYCETHYHQLFGNLCFICNQVCAGDGELVDLVASLCITNIKIFSSLHCLEQSLVRRAFLLYSLRSKTYTEVQVLRIRRKTGVQEVLREVPQ